MFKFEYLLPFLFIGMWILVIFVLSRKGWRDLVEKFRTKSDFEGRRIGRVSASINGVSYSNSLALKINSKGIYMQPILIFRIFHPPVLIPWSEIKYVRDKKIFFYSFKELVIGGPFVALIALKESVYDKIKNPIEANLVKR